MKTWYIQCKIDLINVLQWMELYSSMECFFFEIKLANAVKIMKFILQILVDFVIINLKTIFI